jgi:hypothetical protein
MRILFDSKCCLRLSLFSTPDSSNATSPGGGGGGGGGVGGGGGGGGGRGGGGGGRSPRWEDTGGDAVIVVASYLFAF